MNNSMASQLTDSDMQGAPQALLRAAQRARDVARQTNTPLVLVRNGVLVEECVADVVAKSDEGHLHAPVQPAA